MTTKLMSDERGYIPKKDKAEILGELARQEAFLLERLDDLGLKVDDLEALEALGFKPEGHRRGHEVDGMRQALMALDLLKGDVQAGRVAGLFSNALFLGRFLPKGNRHPWDIEADYREKRITTGSCRNDLKDFEKMRELAIDKAWELWKENDKYLLAEIPSLVLEYLKEKLKHRKVKFPEPSTIRNWLKDADLDESQPFKIPAHATKKGRRPTKK